jgi:hypothetical protein
LLSIGSWKLLGSGKGMATGFSGKKSAGCCGVCVVRAMGVGRLMEMRLREYDRWRGEEAAGSGEWGEAGV